MTPRIAVKRRGRATLATAGAVVALFAAVAVSGAAGATPAAPAPAANQTLNIALAIAPILDPAFFGTNASWTIQDNLFARLTSVDPKTHKVSPWLATSWSASQGSTVWTFHLRKDAKFSDGKPITSADVAYSLTRNFNPVTADQMQALGVTNVFPQGLLIVPDLIGAQDITHGTATALPSTAITTPDKYTVALRLTVARNDIPQRLANPAMGIVEAANVATSTAANPWWQHPVTSGPFIMTSWVTNASLTLAPNPKYFGPKPILKQVNFTVITNVQTAELAYQANSVDFVKTVYSDVLNLKTNYADQLRAYADNNTSVFLVNANGPTANANVARALWMAIDKKTVVHDVLAALPRPAITFTPPQWPGYSAKGFEPITFNPAAAKAELAKSGLAPSSITIRMTYSGSQDPRTAAAIAQEWQQTLGINVIILTTVPPANAPPDQAINMYLQAQGPNFVTPCSMVQRIQDILVTGAGANNSSISPGTSIQPALDSALASCYAAPDSTSWSKVMAIESLNEQHPVFVPVLWNIDYYLVKPYVKSLVLGPNWQIADLSKVWIAAH